MDFKKNIYNIFDSMVYDRSYYEIVSDFFEMSAIAIRNAVDLRPSRETYEERYLQTAKHYKPVVMKSTSQPPTAATAIEPTPTAIEPPKIDKTGQYLLF